MKTRKCKWLNAEIESEMNTRDQLHRNAQESRKEKIGQYIKNNATHVTILLKKPKFFITEILLK